ncbi:MAG: sulfite exporter TauE/SafE family protein [Sporomusaceae bacterium]|nr:sulfite exporter TauE/SafE family protein [Sporomusaceae bacterium]
MLILSYLALGLFIGAFGTLVGVGGGFLLVPLFIMVFHWSPAHAVGTSLAIVFLNALSGSIAYVKQKKVYYDAAIRFSLATLPGAFLGSYLVQYFTGATFRTAFGVLLLIIAVLMFFRPSAKGQQPAFDAKTFTYNRVFGVLLSLVVGFLSSILGIGGGVIHVPAMVYLLSFPPHIATATSHFVLCISSFVGVISHFLLGNILLMPAATIGIGAVIGAQAGAKLSTKTKSRVIMILLAVALFGLGLRLIFTAHAFA